MNLARAKAQSLASSVDTQSRVPLHVQVRKLIREKARVGALVDGEGRLKTEAELGQIFGVSRITIRNALQPLVDEGMFERTRGKGTFLRSSELEDWGGALIGFVESGREAGFEPTGAILHQGMTNQQDADIAKMLNERAVFELKRLRFADGDAVAIEQAFYPPDIGLELEKRDLADAAIYAIFEQELNFEIKDAVQTISATLADKEAARLLDVAVGSPLTFTERLTRDRDDRPLELLRTVYVPERHRFAIRLTRRASSPTE
ncbi:MAG TPA: GntR family transcriptional regulator [Tianweitania sediminis]|nr:GntR family transcriptional regulator [Tianweitania sediminis]